MAGFPRQPRGQYGGKIGRIKKQRPANGVAHAFGFKETAGRLGLWRWF
jgi:hypothetical protein